jgi:ribonuclease P protein subunit RPR2
MRKQKDIEIAKERIKILFEQAEKTKEQSLSNKYIQTARKIGMKFNLKLPRYFNRKFCKHCYNYFKNDNLRVRTKNNKVIYTCLNCKKFTRYPIPKKSK